MSFGEALDALAAGAFVSRRRDVALALRARHDRLFPIRDALFLRDATNNVPGWLASQSDMLARDWYVVRAAKRVEVEPVPELDPVLIVDPRPRERLDGRAEDVHGAPVPTAAQSGALEPGVYICKSCHGTGVVEVVT